MTRAQTSHYRARPRDQGATATTLNRIMNATPRHIMPQVIAVCARNWSHVSSFATPALRFDRRLLHEPMCCSSVPSRARRKPPISQ